MNLALKKLFHEACLEELQAMKPGNVHVFADGHAMTVQDFMKSADAAAEVIVLPDISLGERILQAVKATQNAVHCNTNLGIILLCAPLIQAACNTRGISLREHIKIVLESTNQADAVFCFQAISLANPGGLGKSKQHDVHEVADCTLLEAMQFVEKRDLIAQQYCNDFADVFEFGLTNFRVAMARWQNNSWATTYVYLCYLAHYLDSHIVRKYGEVLAKEVREEAKVHLGIFAKIENPKTYLGKLLQWDSNLKARKINPGTSADLTVATLFIAKLKEKTDGYA